MNQKWNPAIFREYDIRGIAQNEKDLSKELAYCLGLSYAKMSRQLLNQEKTKVSLGRDCRLTSDSLAEGLIEGLLDGGCDVVSLGICPTPLTYFSLFHLNLDGGIMITGSHNASEYNGFKTCIGKETIHGKQIQNLREIMESNPKKAPQKGSFSEFSIIPPYLSYVSQNIQVRKKRKVVLDSGNGTASTVAPALFEAIGAEVIPLYCELDGNFPNHHPDPTEIKNLSDLIAKVKSENADFGVAFDGDADRIGLVDENGKVIFGDETLIILSRELLKSKPGATIISEVKSSFRLYQDIENHGGKPIMWKTGHSLIKSKMKETGAALAGEMSGHIFFADRYFGYDDAIYSAARFYEIASHTDQPVSSFLSNLPQTTTTPEIRVDCEESKKFDLVNETKALLSKLSNISINDIDGVRADFGKGWGLVRASNTQPALVLRFEAVTEDLMKKIRNQIEGALKEAAQKVGHAPLL